MTSEELKFGYLKNENTFQSEIKIFFLFQWYSYTKQSSKNVVEATYKHNICNVMKVVKQKYLFHLVELAQ